MQEQNEAYLQLPIIKHMMQHPEFVERLEAVKLAKRIGVRQCLGRSCSGFVWRWEGEEETDNHV